MKFLLAIFILVLASCTTPEEQSEPSAQATDTVIETPIADNAELIEIYKNDQADRKAEEIDWSVVSLRDEERQARVYALLDSNKVNTSNDYHNAAMVFQHGGDSTSYGMAVRLMRKSIELDSTANKWLLAAATDRYLLSKDEPQIYGTQYQRAGADAPWRLGKMDTTKITDAVRIEYGVETLAQQREKVKAMNSISLSELVAEGKTIDEIVTFIQSENRSTSVYDLSEDGINSFGYSLMSDDKNEEALKIFKLNTELYPSGFNTHDSYGECLLVLGRTEEGIEAYKRSLELNPGNTGAKKIIEENAD